MKIISSLTPFGAFGVPFGAPLGAHKIRNAVVRRIVLWTLSVALLSGGSTMALAASFECRKAKSDIEKTICKTKELSALDDELGRVYREALAKARDKGALRAEQRAWIKERDAACKDDAMCIYQYYQGRIATLRLPRKGPFRIVKIDALTTSGPRDKINIEECSRFTQNLNSFPAWPPMLCERKLSPEFPEFSRPKWRTWSAEELRRRESLFDAMVRRSLMLRNGKPDWESTYNFYMDQARHGGVTVQEARVGSMGTWVRFAIRRPEDTDWTDRKRRAAADRRKAGLPDRWDTDVNLCSWDGYAELSKDGTTMLQPGYGPYFSGGGAGEFLIYRDSMGRQTGTIEGWSEIEPDMGRAVLELMNSTCTIEYRKPVEEGNTR